MKKPEEPLKCDNCPAIAPRQHLDRWHTLLRFTGRAETSTTIVLCPDCYVKRYGKKELPTIDGFDVGNTVH